MIRGRLPWSLVESRAVSQTLLTARASSMSVQRLRSSPGSAEWIRSANTLAARRHAASNMKSHSTVAQHFDGAVNQRSLLRGCAEGHVAATLVDGFLSFSQP
jgi:hypothetical protein